MSKPEKSVLLDRLGAAGEDRLLLARALDLAERTEKRNIPTATGFLTPQQQALCAALLRLGGISRYCFHGGYEGAERRLLLFLPDWQDSADAPVRCLRASFRREDGLTHRDFLGSLMGMGVVRESVGDILVSEESADLLVLESVADFLLQSWESAGRSRLRVQEIAPAHLHIPQVNIQEVRDTVSSVRLDAIVSSGFRMSRGKAAELIGAGRVQVNWRECLKPDKPLSQGDTVSARGFGKLELAEIGGLTRKGRVSILIRRYL